MLRVKQTTGVVTLLLFFAAATAPAGDMYKWQDEDGIWHFGDRPPAEDQAFETFTVPAEPSRMVSMRQEGSQHHPVYLFFNHYWGPLELEISVSDAVNIVTKPPLPARIVIPGQSEVRAVQFRAADPHQSFQYRLKYAHVPGPPQADLPQDLDFFPPFPSGMTFPVTQGIDDATTHNRPGSHYAVDIAMPEGTPVLAARGGIVMEMEDDFHGGGQQEERYIDRANFVRILHDDGSMAIYAHLQPNSARVYPGGRVPTGAWIANSGNTGFSSGPHLHFAIQMNAGMALESLPFRFRQAGGAVVTPDTRMILGGVLTSP
jgi:murein DD-endopeptidase MepM/ murein hydrolase activator NlpD